MVELYQVTSSAGSEDSGLSIGAPPQYWAGAIATFMPFSVIVVGAVSIISSDSGSGIDSQSGFAVLKASADTGSGADSQSFPGPFGTPVSSDAGTGTDAQQGPPVLPVWSADYSSGFDTAGIAHRTRAPLPALPIFEGFSLSRVAVLSAVGLENAQLVGAQSIVITPAITASDMKADDDEYGTWYVMEKADITVTNGFMSWNTIALLGGVAVARSGVSPNDYYGLPLWSQYQHNKPTVPMAFRMNARDTRSAVRTLDFVLYRVQLSVLDYTGTVYKQGLGVSYKGTVTFSSVDEAGNSLPGPEIGRIVSSPGSLAGTLGPLSLQGV
jgi:hypothetical protein